MYTNGSKSYTLMVVIVALVVGRAQTGRLTRPVKVKSHVVIHGNEMADKVASEATESKSKTI